MSKQIDIAVDLGVVQPLLPGMGPAMGGNEGGRVYGGYGSVRIVRRWRALDAAS
jgi:hypothetical protein